jgi:hypothetical protein
MTLLKPDYDDEPHIKPFASYLTDTNQGRTHSELSEKLHELVEAVLRTGKAGTLALTVKVDADNVDNRRLVISEVVTAKLPTGPAKKSVFWANDKGNLVRNDPSQLQFGDIRPVAPPVRQEQA